VDAPARDALQVHVAVVEGERQVVFVRGDPDVHPVAGAHAQSGHVELDSAARREVEDAVGREVDNAVVARVERRHHMVAALEDAALVGRVRVSRGRRSTVRAVLGGDWLQRVPVLGTANVNLHVVGRAVPGVGVAGGQRERRDRVAVEGRGVCDNCRPEGGNAERDCEEEHS
jgi:hypothetical protein